MLTGGNSGGAHYVSRERQLSSWAIGVSGQLLTEVASCSQQRAHCELAEWSRLVGCDAMSLGSGTHQRGGGGGAAGLQSPKLPKTKTTKNRFRRYKHINTLCGQNVEFVNIKRGGTYSDHC
jgi:hypothetical protein